MRLSLNSIIGGTLVLAGLGLTVYVGRVVVESIQVSLSIDETVAIPASPMVQKQVLEKAMRVLYQSEQEKSVKETIQPEKPAEKQASESATPEQLPVEPLKEPVKVEVINTTTVSGAAGMVGTIFSEFTQVELKNSESRLDESTILYKNEYRDQVDTWKVAMAEKGWPVGATQERPSSDPVDVSIYLGRP